jgi:adenosylcobinamide kinase/adenosylcobinamide-phosphate guanylyltransferase
MHPAIFSRKIKMKKITLVIGGCKSGKSRYALEAADRKTTQQKIFIATSVPFDDEMKDRVERHRRERGDQWTTVEAPVDLPGAIRANTGKDRLILVDCLTLWINNLLMETTAERVIQGHFPELVDALNHIESRIYLVANEVGTGIVPENRLARQFRDIAGVVNQAIAALADQVVWMVAGIPVQIK